MPQVVILKNPNTTTTMKIEIHELNEGDIVAFKHGANLEFEDDGKILDLWEDESVVSVRCDAIDDELEINCSQIFAVDQSPWRRGK